MKNYKIDENIKFNIALCNEEHMLDCIVYVSNIDKAKSFFNKFDGIELIGEYPFINSIIIKTSIKNLREISNQRFVEYISSQSKVSALINVSKKILKCEDFYKDSPCICFVDTGISPHCDFCIPKPRIVKFLDLVNGIKNPYDDNGHGTFVSGICSGSGIICKKYKGILPNSKIISIKALDKNGEAPTNKILEAMQWIIDNHKSYDIKVVCMSFGSEPLGINDPIMKGADVLWNHGICVVAAAGNSGPKHDTIKSPGISNKIITVGGFNDNRFLETYDKNEFQISEFSSRGPALRRYKPDIVAPSVNIKSCSNKNDFYCELSGTSVAAPMIAGIMALILNRKKINIDTAKRLLLKSSTGITFNRNDEGFGYPNVERILEYLKKI